jgi:hypothetical protein
MIKPTIYAAFLLSVVLALGQEATPSLPKFQEFASPTDERVKVFLEIEAKAEAGDTRSLEKLGEYYFYGNFPVVQNQQKAKDTWMVGARLGSGECAGWIQSSYPDGTNDSEVLIEKEKWGIIKRQLQSKGRLKSYRKGNISESSFEEAKRRAEEFLATVKAAPNQSDILRDFTVPGLGSIKEAQAFRRDLLAEFRKVQSPLYVNASMASPADVASYSLVASKLAIVQKKGIGGFSSASFSSGPQQQLNEAKIKELREQLRAFKLKTSPPFNRQDLNQAQAFLDRYRDLLDAIEKGL